MKKALVLLLAFVAASACSEGGGDDSGRPDASTDGDTDTDSDTDTWSQAVDEFWGDGPGAEDRAEVLDTVWGQMADSYACFGVYEGDWDQDYEEYSSKMQSAESYGAFYRTLRELVGEVQDGHTSFRSDLICDTPSVERPPYFTLGMRTTDLGACITRTNGGDLLVYKVEEGNPLGLEPGDILIGYDGKSWEGNLEDIAGWDLPICGTDYSTPEAQEDQFAASAMNNAHLFETIQIRRHGAAENEIVGIDDDLLGHTSTLACTSQLGMEGIEYPFTDFVDMGDAGAGIGFVEWGILPGNIGYIVPYIWLGQAGADFTQAVTDLMGTDGLIIDHRFNFGGWPSWNDGLEQLFDTDLYHVTGLAVRDPATPGDYTALILDEGSWADTNMTADALTFYDAPIAVLTGPTSVSAGDEFPYIMGMHPRAKKFGRGTNGSFGAVRRVWDADDPLLDDLSYSFTIGVLVDSEEELLQGVHQEPDFPVWMEVDDAAQGVDTVLEAAISWIQQ